MLRRLKNPNLELQQALDEEYNPILVDKGKGVLENMGEDGGRGFSQNS